MGQVIGTTDSRGGEATSQLYGPQHLLATVMQTLFDPGLARLESGLPTVVARSITASEPIRELMS